MCAWPCAGGASPPRLCNTAPAADRNDVTPGCGTSPPPSRIAASVSTANRSRGVIPIGTGEACRAPVNSARYARTMAMPFSPAATASPTPTSGFASIAPSTRSSAATNPSVPGNPTLPSPVSRNPTASVGDSSYSPP